MLRKCASGSDLRKRFGLTQVDLAAKAGVGLRFVRELEQGKQTLRIDKVNQVLALFGYEVGAVPAGKEHSVWEGEKYTWMIYIYAGTLTEDENGFTFVYDAGFLRYPAGTWRTFHCMIRGWAIVWRLHTICCPRLLSCPRIRRSSPGGSGKVIENIAWKFRRSIIKWMELIDVSFLPEDMKKPYKRLVLQRLLWLRWKIFPFLF